MIVEFNLNGRWQKFDVAPGEYLLDTLRHHDIVSVKKGCDESSCGVCTVLVDGKPTLSCSLLSIRVAGRHVLTVEGLEQEVSAISDEFGHEGADQCGFCNPGMALVIHALTKENPHPSDEEIRSYLRGNLCRCSGYEAQFKAVKRYLEARK